jgi:polysaccharide pyruvyl transferase WcaK-like protein
MDGMIDDRRAPVRVLMHTGTLDCRNVGDVAMLQAAVEGLRQLWPAVETMVVTADPAQLERHCPGTVPVQVAGFRAWTSDHYLVGGLDRHMPAAAGRQLVAMSRALRRRWPAAAAGLAGLRGTLRGRRSTPLGTFRRALARADLVFACGQGTLADAGVTEAVGLLGFLECGASLGKRTALVGQGIGPLDNPQLRARAATVLGRVDFIGLRERRAGVPLLRSLAVPDSRVLATGDDAVEGAYRARPVSLGGGIGINIRVAAGAGVDSSLIADLRPLLHRVARTHRAALVPLPISNHADGTRDPAVIRELLRGYDGESDGGERLETPAAVIEQAARCRVVITGAYHAAVFALAQGIPTVCIAKSPYVLDKMRGLADLFGAGCAVIEPDARHGLDALAAAADDLWDAAEYVRPSLLEAARSQVALGHEGYRRVGALVNAS